MPLPHYARDQKYVAGQEKRRDRPGLSSRDEDEPAEKRSREIRPSPFASRHEKKPPASSSAAPGPPMSVDSIKEMMERAQVELLARKAQIEAEMPLAPAPIIPVPGSTERREPVYDLSARIQSSLQNSIFKTRPQQIEIPASSFPSSDSTEGSLSTKVVPVIRDREGRMVDAKSGEAVHTESSASRNNNRERDGGANDHDDGGSGHGKRSRLYADDRRLDADDARRYYRESSHREDPKRKGK